MTFINGLAILFCLITASSTALFASGESSDKQDQPPVLSEVQPPIETDAKSFPTGGSSRASNILEAMARPTEFAQSAALYDLLQRSGTDELKKFALEAQTLSEPADRNAALSIIYGRYSDLDPEQALSDFISSRISAGNNILWSMFFSWSKIDLDNAITQCLNLSNPISRQVATQGIMAAHRDLDFDKQEQIAQRLGSVAIVMLGGLKERYLAQLADIDPQAAIDEVLQLEDPVRREAWLNIVAKKWGAQDPIAALEFGENLDSWVERLRFREDVLTGLAREEPEEVLDLLDSELFSANEKFSLMRQALRTLTRIDPQIALERAQAFTSEDDREWALGITIGYVAESDVDDAIELLDSLQDWYQAERFFQQAISTITREDTQRALSWARSHSETMPKLIHQVINTIAQDNPEYALNLLAELPDSQEKHVTFNRVLQMAAYSDPEAAASALKSYQGGSRQAMFAEMISRFWFGSEPETALTWMFSLDMRLQTEVLISRAPNIVEYKLPYAEQMLPDLPNARVRNAWISEIVNQLSRDQGPEVALEWLGPFRDESGYVAWRNRLLSTMAEVGSARDAIRMADVISDTTQHERAILSIVTSWVARDAPAAANWVLNEPNVANRDALIKAVVDQWGRYDLKPAQQWLMRFKQSDERDLGLSQLLATEYLDVQQADSLLRNIISPTFRFSGLQAYVGKLARFDAAAARVFLARQIITTDQMDALLGIVEDAENGVFFVQETVH